RGLRPLLSALPHRLVPVISTLIGFTVHLMSLLSIYIASHPFQQPSAEVLIGHRHVARDQRDHIFYGAGLAGFATLSGPTGSTGPTGPTGPARLDAACAP